MESNLQLTQLREETYRAFRPLAVKDHKGKLSTKDIDVFRNLLLLMIAYNVADTNYQVDIQDTQMSAEFLQYTFTQREVRLPKDFTIDGKLETEKGYYYHFYAIFQDILINRSKTPFCFMLPYFGYYPSTYQLTKYDVPRIERYAFTFWNYYRGSKTKEIDLLYDYVEVSEALRSLIDYTFSDRSSKSEYVIDRTMSLFREIAVCWACAILSRTKFNNAGYDDLVARCFTMKTRYYHYAALKN